MIFGRVKPIDAILNATEGKTLHRTLGAFQLMLFGIGCVIGTGIFVLTAVGAQKAGPGLLLAFAIAGAICIVAALCYAEIAAMMPVAGSAYTYSYATVGEFLAWTVGWALILEYAVAASAVAVGWSGYFTGTILHQYFGVHLPVWLSAGPLALGGTAGGFINLPAVIISLLITWLLIIGTSESAKVNAVLVAIKVTALTAFIALTLTSSDFDAARFNPFLPAGYFGGFGSGIGAVGAAATIFFRLCRVRCRLYRSGGDQGSAAQRADRTDRVAVVLHRLLHPRRGGRDRDHWRPAGYGAERRPLPCRFRRAGTPVRDLCRGQAATGVLERGACSHAARDRVQHDRQFHGRCRLPGAAVGDPGADLRSDPHLLRDEPRTGCFPRC